MKKHEKTMTDRPLGLVECTMGITSEEEGVTIRLLRDGETLSKNGRFIVDEESARLVLQAFEEHNVPLQIDWEHQSLRGEFARADGLAPASGWVDRIWYEPGEGIFGSVRWTEKAREAIHSREYQFLSPVVVVRPEDGKVVALDSCALCNRPAIQSADRLAASTRVEANADEPAGVTVSASLVQALRRTLKLEDDVSADEILQRAIKKIEAKKKPDGDDEDEAENDTRVAQSVRAKLALPADAGADAVTLAMTLHQEAQSQAEVLALRQRLAERDADDAIRPYILDGRINPNDAEDVQECRRMAMTDRACFDHHMKRRLPNPPPGRTTAPPRPTAGSRSTIIANARREYEKPGQHQRLTTSKAFVDLRLREAGQELLSPDEAKQLGDYRGCQANKN